MFAQDLLFAQLSENVLRRLSAAVATMWVCALWCIVKYLWTTQLAEVYARRHLLHENGGFEEQWRSGVMLSSVSDIPRQGLPCPDNETTDSC